MRVRIAILGCCIRLSVAFMGIGLSSYTLTPRRLFQRLRSNQAVSTKKGLIRRKRTCSMSFVGVAQMVDCRSRAVDLIVFTPAKISRWANAHRLTKSTGRSPQDGGFSRHRGGVRMICLRNSGLGRRCWEATCQGISRSGCAEACLWLAAGFYCRQHFPGTATQALRTPPPCLENPTSTRTLVKAQRNKLPNVRFRRMSQKSR